MRAKKTPAYHSPVLPEIVHSATLIQWVHPPNRKMHVAAKLLFLPVSASGIVPYTPPNVESGVHPELIRE
jgi:hypothetical protein